VIENKKRDVTQKAKRSAEGDGVLAEEEKRNYSLFVCGICDFNL